MKRITLRDVAENAGVSIMTASAVVRGQAERSRISEATRLRVEEAVRQLEYQPNAVARSLRTQSTEVIGFYAGYNYLGGDNPFFHAILGGLFDGCHEIGRELLFFQKRPSLTALETRARLTDRRVDGLVLWTYPQDPVLQGLRPETLPIISMEARLASFCTVEVDDEAGMLLLLQRLYANGHRRLVYFDSSRVISSLQTRRQTVENFAAAHGLRLEVELEPAGQPDDVSGKWPAKMENWLAEWKKRPGQQRPTAALCWCDHRAYMLLQYCRNQGIKNPHDIAVTGFDHLPPPPGLKGQLTTIEAPWHEVARTAIHLLEDALGGAKLPTHVRLPVKLAVGKSA